MHLGSIVGGRTPPTELVDEQLALLEECKQRDNASDREEDEIRYHQLRDPRPFCLLLVNVEGENAILNIIATVVPDARIRNKGTYRNNGSDRRDKGTLMTATCEGRWRL